MLSRHLFLALSFCAFTALGTATAQATAAETIQGDITGDAAYYKIKPKDTLYKIARQFDVGTVALLAANPDVDLWMPKAEAVLTLPTQHILPPAKRSGIVINLAEMRLFYFPTPQTVMSFPIGIGMRGWETSTGTTSIIKKRKNPAWIPPPSIRAEDPTLPAIFPPGPNNPLGEYALNLGFDALRIHGTNRPDSIGKRASHGCIRLYPEDIAILFSLVDVGTPVTIIDRPYKLGWQKDTLFLQITPTQQQSDDIIHQKPMEFIDIPEVYGDIKSMAQAYEIDWVTVQEAITQRTGIPVAITLRK